jgi:hypothetical protein
MNPRGWILPVTLMLTLPAALQADTLYLRNGTRIEGELIGVRNGTIEFEERRSFGSSRTVRVDRNEIERIEFDNRGSTSSSNSNTSSSNAVGGRPGGMRERQASVLAIQQWTDTGIDVRSGQTVYFEAQGKIRWGKDRTDGPEGEHNSPPNANRPMSNRNAAALIGKIGSDMFFIGGETGPMRMRSSGRLYLGINDDVLTDNSGNFRVVVYY